MSIRSTVFGVCLIILGAIGCFVPLMPGIILIILGIAVLGGKDIHEAFDELKDKFRRK